MKRYLVMTAAAALAGSVILTSSPVGAGTLAGGVWGKAQEVPGSAKLNSGGRDGLLSMSCASAGNCSAGGYYYGGPNDRQGFVVSEVNGVWGNAEEVPGTATLNSGDYGEVTSVSCASAGNCSAVGWYTIKGRFTDEQVFAVSQVNGVWGKAAQMPGTAGLNSGDDAVATAVSCASAGNCSAGGSFTDTFGFQAFVASQVNGVWAKARQVPGTARLNTGMNAQVTSVSCASAGNCGVAGWYSNLGREPEGFVASEVNGVWARAQKVPGHGVFSNVGSEIYSVSCASAGNCSTGGYYVDSSSPVGHGFVASEVNGTWQKAQQVPGRGVLSNMGAYIYSVSCASAGNCSTGGSYGDSSGTHAQAFVASQVNGTWQKAQEVPGTATLNTGGTAQVTSVSCASPGNCSAGGFYTDSSANRQAFVVNEVNGTWGTAEEVPGTGALNTHNAEVDALSCAPAGGCGAGGSYTSASGIQVFVASRS